MWAGRLIDMSCLYAYGPQPASDSEPSQHVIASRSFHEGSVVIKQSSHRLLLDLLCQGFFQGGAEGAICPPLKDLCPPLESVRL